MNYTRTKATEAQYLSRGDGLLLRYRDETNCGETVDPLSFAHWLVDQRNKYSPSTWRIYRRSAQYVIKVTGHPEAAEAIAVLDVPVDHAANSKRHSKQTSGTKVKSIPYEDYEKLLAYLRYFSKSKHWQIARSWMIAAAAVGLRPAEWANAEIIESDSQIHLRVRNAKATNDRANGLYRTIIISDFRPETLDAIRHMAAAGSQWAREGRYDDMQLTIAQAINSACETIFTKTGATYCLYSLRHQFTSNMKSMKTRQEVSALLGHCATRTAMKSYGKKRQAWSVEHIADVPVALDSEIETVSDNARLFSASTIAQRRLAA